MQLRNGIAMMNPYMSGQNRSGVCGGSGLPHRRQTPGFFGE